MASQGLFRCSSDEANVAHHSSQAVTCVCADERTGRSVVFLDNGICSVFVPEDGASGCPAYFKFGARSGDSSDFRHIPSTISTCASLDGFDVVFSQAGSALLHCLPLGDYDGTQEFVPALSFTRMPGDIAQLACVPESELLAAADTQGALALFSTSDATRLDYKPECCRRLVTALHAQQGLLVSGDAGGEIRVWNISEASLVPILTLSTPGQVTATLVTHIAQPKGSLQDSRQVVAGTNEGDIFVWDVDMGNVSEPWEAHNAEVLQVGMLSLSNTAVTQLRYIPADDYLSRVCCLDLSNAPSPAIVSNDTPPQVCHMLATTLDQPETFHPLSGGADHHHASLPHLMLTLWTRSLDSGITLQQLSVPTVKAPHQPPYYSAGTHVGAVSVEGADRSGMPESESSQNLLSQAAGNIHPPIDRAATSSHAAESPSIIAADSAASMQPDQQHRAHARDESVVDPRTAEAPPVVDHLSNGQWLDGASSEPFSVSMQGGDLQEEDSGSGFSLRALQPARIVTAPPDHIKTLRSAPNVADGASKEAGGSVQAAGEVESISRFREDSMGQGNSFGLRTEALLDQRRGPTDAASSTCHVRDSSELESRQLAELLGLDFDVADSPLREGGGSRVQHEHLDNMNYSGEGNTFVKSDEPLRMDSSDAFRAAVAEHSSGNSHPPHAVQFARHPLSGDAQIKVAEGSRGVDQHGSTADIDVPVSGSIGQTQAPARSSRTAQTASVPGEGENVSWDALRAVREQLEAMCCDDEDDGVINEVPHAPDVSPPAALRSHVAGVPADGAADSVPSSDFWLQSSASGGAAEPSHFCTEESGASHHAEQGNEKEELYGLPNSGPAVPERKAALHVQFEMLQLGKDPRSFQLPEQSSSPIHQFQPHGTHSVLPDTLTNPTPEQWMDPQAAPDSPDSLRSSSVFVSGALKRAQHPNAVEQSHHSEFNASTNQVVPHMRADRSSIDLWRHQRTLAPQESTGVNNSRDGAAVGGVHTTYPSSESHNGAAEPLDQWLSSSQSAVLRTSTGAFQHNSRGATDTHHRLAAEQHHQSPQVGSTMHPEWQASGMKDAAPSEQEPFSLSQLAAAQHDEQHAPDINEPTEERQSGGGIAWALQASAERPFSRSSRSYSSREGSSRICGRQSGHIAAASMHDVQYTPPHAGQQPRSTGTTLQPIPRKPSTAALLRRLTRKKPTVRQILGKVPQPQNGLLTWRQEHAAISPAHIPTPTPSKYQHARTTSRSPAPRAPSSHNRVTGHVMHPPTRFAGQTPPRSATPPTNTSRIPSLAKSDSGAHYMNGLHATDSALAPAATPPQGIILVPANPKLLYSSTGSVEARSMPSNNKLCHSTARRGHTRSPSPYHRRTMHRPHDDSTLPSQSLGRKAPRRVPLQDRMNTPPSSNYHLPAQRESARDSAGHESWDGAAGAENRQPSNSTSRPSYQPQRKRSCGAHARGVSGKSTTVTTVHAPAAGTNDARASPHGTSTSRLGKSTRPVGHAATATVSPAHAVQWDHPHGAVVTEGALLQESSVTDRPPMSVARWKVERSAGELANSQHAAISMYANSGAERDHLLTRNGEESMQCTSGTQHIYHGAEHDIHGVQGSGRGIGLIGLLSQEQNERREVESGIEAPRPRPVQNLRRSVGESHCMHEQNAHKHKQDVKIKHSIHTDTNHDEHPLARPRPGGMTQLLASRIASTAAETAPAVPESSHAFISARRTAATIAAKVPSQSTLYVAVPAVPPALAAARAAAAAAIANGEATGGSSIAAGNAAGAAAASTALDALRKQAEKRIGKAHRTSQRNNPRSIIPPPLMEDLWKWDEQVVQEAPFRALPPPPLRSLAQITAEMLQLHRCC